MNKNDLRDILIKENFKPSAYSLDDEIKDEALCLRKEDNGWCVFYSERGLQTAKEYFKNESEACEYFIDEMRDDPTTKADWKSGFSM
ncbi:MAG: hypothetical protein KBT82_06600 [Marinobacter sp.]|uniref:hypothetical protein n=1 Tax=Marinobacter sp. TaxID=50741 RepID=UPI001B511AE5|nr:hypothetical protein [Marinobacter sp.]MBQ0746315.1 hypothetical protein [Marinobacter sp.]MBQ0813835.1 hypothetical protein [Marinobacter sp.]|tara:strand:+ start:293 stop:553 length:261 start_codon:yes stop_codon:yes gene_type:complete